MIYSVILNFCQRYLHIPILPKSGTNKGFSYSILFQYVRESKDGRTNDRTDSPRYW